MFLCTHLQHSEIHLKNIYNYLVDPLSIGCTFRVTYIFPAQSGVTVFTVNVGHCVESCKQQPLLSGTTTNINPESYSEFTDQAISLEPSFFPQQNRAGFLLQLLLCLFIGKVYRTRKTQHARTFLDNIYYKNSLKKV